MYAAKIHGAIAAGEMVCPWRVVAEGCPQCRLEACLSTTMASMLKSQPLMYVLGVDAEAYHRQILVPAP